MLEFWLLSLPGEPTKEDAFQRLRLAQRDTPVHRFDLPDLKVGTLDSLLVLSDSLAESNKMAEGAIKSVFHSLYIASEKSKNEMFSKLQVDQLPLHEFIVQFKWKLERYSPLTPISQLCSTMKENISRTMADVQVKQSSYEALRASLKKIAQKSGNSLLNCQLNGIVDPQDVVDSEYLLTVAVVVPKANAKQFMSTYETLVPMIVPRSIKRVTDDPQSVLFLLTIFKKSLDQLYGASREHSFSVRTIEFNVNEMEEMGKEKEQLEEDLPVYYTSLIRSLMSAFSEIMIDWMHLKGLFLFVESTLRYGLPPNFQGILLFPAKKSAKQLKISLLTMYAHLAETNHNPIVPKHRRRLHFHRSANQTETQALMNDGGPTVQIPARNGQPDINIADDDYPFVFFTTDVDF